MVIYMKKLKILFMTLLFLFPIPAFAYDVILGGETIGIDIKSNGILIIGFYKVDGKYPTSDLKEGDVIIKVGKDHVYTINELTSSIEKNLRDGKVNITYLRDNKEKTATLDLIKQNGVYKTGLYVKDSITGIGTITFIDPNTNKYGALGHEIVETSTSNMVEVKEGMIFKNSITSIEPSTNGNPGSKNAKFYYGTTYGDIIKNTKYGIYGNYNAEYDKDKLIEVGDKDDVKIGPAKIYTVLNKEIVEEFDINITKINENSKIKNISFEIIDENLLKKTGGVVQGMSGSPIVQNDKIIGAVTHVITDNVTTGYGIFITTMLEESKN